MSGEPQLPVLFCQVLTVCLVMQIFSHCSYRRKHCKISVLCELELLENLGLRLEWNYMTLVDTLHYEGYIVVRQIGL